jgi:hypothetical protein
MPEVVGTAPHPLARALTRALGAFAFAVLLWLIGFEVGAIVVVVTAVVLTVLSLLVPTARAVIERVVAKIAHVVGEVLNAVLLTIAHVLIFWPASLVLRLVGHDPLGPGVRSDDPSFWYQRRARALPTRPYADERSLWSRGEVTGTRRSRVHTVVFAAGVVVVLLALDLAAGAVYDGVRDLTHPQAAGASLRGQTFDPTAQPALRDAPYATELLAEQEDLPHVDDPFLSYRLLDFDGVYTHIRNGARASYQPPLDGRRPARILFFGGSALFGSGQRDEHTIPSEVARLAEADGIPVEVVNYGRPGYANWSEVELFEQVVSAGETGDAVVFYDGFNDLHIQMNVGLFTEPTTSYDAAQTDPDAIPTFTPNKRAEATAIDDVTGWDDVVDAYWANSGVHHVVDDIEAIFGGGESAPEVEFVATGESGGTNRRAEGAAVTTAATNAVHLTRRGFDIAEAVADGYDMDSYFFWQPFLYTKKIVAGEDQLQQLVPYEPERWVPAVAQARRELRAPVIDLGTALDATDQPVMWDFVHTNELGARLVAESMYEHLKPTLVAATRSRSGDTT